MIGGTDIVLHAPPGVPVVELILRRLRRWWPEGLFQDADSAQRHPLSDRWVSLCGTMSTEFFIYCDRSSADTCDRLGVLPAETNRMLHFLIGQASDSGLGLQEVTVVCDRHTPEIDRLIKDLDQSFCVQRPLFAALGR